MALITVKKVFELDKLFVLSPERYDPRRESLVSKGQHTDAITVGDIAEIVRQSISPNAKVVSDRLCIVLDTSDVREGIVIGRKKLTNIADLGSQKKIVSSGDVIISRLRPYLRQVAFVDSAFAAMNSSAVLACSTEFYVLRSLDKASIAFLVPYLLSEPVQCVLAASQEGGHHPRFDANVLLNLPIPVEFFEKRTTASVSVEQSIASYREAEEIMINLVAEADSAMSHKPS